MVNTGVARLLIFASFSVFSHIIKVKNGSLVFDILFVSVGKSHVIKSTLHRPKKLNIFFFVEESSGDLKAFFLLLEIAYGFNL